jgi:tetratricopeptide (TPR) repeat protein
VSLWWQIQIHPESRELDQEFRTLADSTIESAAAWARREPDRAEAWFYLAGSYAPLVQWQVLRGERLAAARAGSKIKSALERTLELDPALADAHFGIGMYHYYADVAPAAAKLIRWLLFLPGGNRVEGLREMQQAHDEGELLSGEADYQLHLIDLWYEHKPREALDLLKSLEARYPFNPLFLQRIAEVEDVYFHDHRASANAWQELLDRAQKERIADAEASAVRARLGLAAQLVALDRPADAIEHLKIVIDLHPTSPAGARTRADAMMRAIAARQLKN